MTFDFNWEAYLKDNPKCLMGVINVTPDSFSGDGVLGDAKSISNLYNEYSNLGISMVDVGAESTYPKASPVSLKEEMSRISFFLENIDQNFLHSVDSYKPKVISKCLDSGFNVVNDVSGIKDKKIIKILQNRRPGIILNHRHPRSQYLHEKFQYTNPIKEVKEHLMEKTKDLINSGVPKESIAIDPALGFGKDQEVSYEILNNIDQLDYGYPLVIGFSNKKFSRRFDLNNSQLTQYLFSKGVSVIRTHLLDHL